MQQAFSNILVPVDFSANMEVAVAKALDVIGNNNAALHLLHAKTHLFRSRMLSHGQENAKRLEAWKEVLEEAVPLLSVSWSIDIAASVEQSIINKAAAVNADLIVLGKNTSASWLRFTETVNPSRLAGQAATPVLTVRPGSMHQSIKTVLVPISEISPQSKMEALASLCGRMRPAVHLVAFSRHSALSQAATSTLLQLFHWVKNTLHCPVEYTLVDGRHPAKQLMAYAEKTGADLLLMYPEAETRLRWWNRHIEDVLPAHSKVQVLTIHR